jgi:hypothetical protein
MVTNQRVDGQVLTVTAALVGTTLFRCNANNGIGTNDLFINITVNGKKKEFINFSRDC